MKLSYFFFCKLLSKLPHQNRHEYVSTYFRKKGVSVGVGCNILSDITTSEPYLVSIGDNVTIAQDVLLLTHDASVGKIYGKENGSDVVGRVVIGDNCFVGARSIILPGVTIAGNTIIAAGSVVTKSIDQSEVIIGGNPARIISNWNDLKERTEETVFQLHGKKGKEAKLLIMENANKLIKK